MEKNKLYSNKCDLTQIKNAKKKIRLIIIFYVFDFEINFLLIKRLCKIRFKESFNEYDFYIRNKQKQLTLKVTICNNVYIVNKITKELNKLIFIVIIIDNVKNVSIVSLFTNFELNIKFIDSNNVISLKLKTNNFFFDTINESKLKKYRF